LKLVLKFGGTSISSPEKIRTVAKHIRALSKGNELVIVCSAVSGVTDDLIQITNLVQKGNIDSADKLSKAIINKHKQLAKKLIKNPKTRKKLSEKMNSDLSDLEGLLHGMFLLGEVTSRSSDYLISFGERLSINLVSFALVDYVYLLLP